MRQVILYAIKSGSTERVSDIVKSVGRIPEFGHAATKVKVRFGGEKNKKMMVARFREVLLSIQHLEMPKQLTHMQNYFEEWKGENEQVDDVLVIGVRV